MKAAIILFACFVVISADNPLGDNAQQSLPHILSRRVNAQPVVQLPDNIITSSEPGSARRSFYYWRTGPFPSVQWNVRRQWLPYNYYQQQLTNTHYGSSSSDQHNLRDNSINFAYHGSYSNDANNFNTPPPASYLLKRLGQRLLSHILQNSLSYESYWDILIGQFVQHYIHDNPSVLLVIKGQDRIKILDNIRAIIISMVEYMKQHPNIRWRSDQQKEDLLAELERNVVSPQIVLNSLQQQQMEAVTSKNQEDTVILQQSEVEDNDINKEQLTHLRDSLTVLPQNADVDNSQIKKITNVPPFQIPNISSATLQNMNEESSFEANEENSQNSLLPNAIEEQSSSDNLSSAIPLDSAQESLVNEPPGEVDVILPPADDSSYNEGSTSFDQQTVVPQFMPAPSPSDSSEPLLPSQVVEPIDVQLENGYRPTLLPNLPPKPLPLPEIVDTPIRESEFENSKRPAIFLNLPSKPLPLREFIQHNTREREFEYNYRPAIFSQLPSKYFTLPEIINQKFTSESDFENNYRPAYFPNLPSKPFTLPRVTERPTTESDLENNYGPVIFPNNTLKPEPLPEIIDPSCDKLKEIFNDLNLILRIQEINKETQNLKLLFKIIKLFIMHHRLDNESFGVIVRRIRSTLLPFMAPYEDNESELETGLKLLENEFETGKISRIIQAIRSGQERDLSEVMHKIKLSLDQFKQKLMMRRFSAESIKVLLKRAVLMASKVGIYFLEECKSRKINYISSTLMEALNLSQEEETRPLLIQYQQ